MTNAESRATMPRMKISKMALVAVVVLGGAGCGSSDSGGSTAAPTPCNVDPWTCPAGQTCWATDMSGAFGCLNSDSTKSKGDSCVNSVGQPTCPDDMICLQLQGQAKGVCAPYCSMTDPGKACDTGETCVTLLFGGSQAHACRPAAGNDGGIDAEPDATGEDAAQDGESDAAPADAGQDAEPDAANDDAASDGATE